MNALIIEVEGGWGIGPVEWKDPDVDFTEEFTIESITMDTDWAEGMYTRFHNVTKAHPGVKVSTYSEADGDITPCVKDLHFTPLNLQRFFTLRYSLCGVILDSSTIVLK